MGVQDIATCRTHQSYRPYRKDYLFTNLMHGHNWSQFCWRKKSTQLPSDTACSKNIRPCEYQTMDLWWWRGLLSQDCIKLPFTRMLWYRIPPPPPETHVRLIYRGISFAHNINSDVWQSRAGPRLNIKTVLSTYGDFHVKDKTAVRTSYL